jgi:small neutral amino acid transporter SnatA (MarC family)
MFYFARSSISMIQQLIKFFVVFFVVVEPISLIPLFAGLTEGADAATKKPWRQRPRRSRSASA